MQTHDNENEPKPPVLHRGIRSLLARLLNQYFIVLGFALLPFMMHVVTFSIVSPYGARFEWPAAELYLAAFLVLVVLLFDVANDSVDTQFNRLLTLLFLPGAFFCVFLYSADSYVDLPHLRSQLDALSWIPLVAAAIAFGVYKIPALQAQSQAVGGRPAQQVLPYQRLLPTTENLADAAGTKTELPKTEAVADGGGSQQPELAASNALAIARDAAFLATIFLYFIGWTYIHGFLKRLELPFSESVFPLTSVLIYAFPVILSNWIPYMVFAVISLLVMAVIVMFRQRGRLYPPYQGFVYVVVSAVLILRLFFVCYDTADAQAKEYSDMVRATADKPATHYFLTAAAARITGAHFRELNGSGRLVQIYEDEKNYFAIERARSNKVKSPPRSFVIPRSSVLQIETYLPEKT